MKKRRRPGRTARTRSRKHLTVVQSVSLCHQDSYVRLLRFLKQKGFASTVLQPAQFTDTGRGLQTLRALKPGELLISLPEACLLTTDTVLHSDVGPLIKRWRPRPSALLVLCVFLVLERHRAPLSEWAPYIDVLPSSYTCPAYFTDDVIALLPPSVQSRALEQRTSVQELHSSNQSFFQSFQCVVSEPVQDVFTFEALRWAWCTVNTRSVFMARSQSHFLSGQDVCALAPFLDLLNHRPDVQVSASFNSDTRCYEILSVCGMERHHQAFINYGSHDNQRLLLEYGFVADNNPHSVVYVDSEHLCKVLHRDTSLQQKMKFLSQNELLRNLTVSSEGPGWRLLTAARVLSLPQTQFALWKSALLGQRLSEERERWCLQTVRSVCVLMLQDTDAALEKISELLQRSDASVAEQLGVVLALRREERCILGKCLEILPES